MRTLSPALVALAFALAAQGLSAADWPQFRGPGGSATSADSGLPVSWSATENVVWKTSLPGFGTSSPITTGKLVFVTCYSGYGEGQSNLGSQDRLQRHLVCLDRDSGRIQWERKIQAALPEEDYSGFQALHGFASSTPATDGKNVYVFFGKSGVYAFDLAGKQLWRADVGSGTDGWGSATSPVVHKNVVIVNASVESGAVVGLSARNGSVKWRAQGSQRSWSTPVLVDVKGKKELVLSIQGTIGAFDPEDGKALWRAAGIQDYVCPTVVAADGVVYAIGGRQNTCLAVRAGGKGEVSKLWEQRAGSNVTSPVVHQGHLYWVSDDGIANCLEAKTGEIVYQERLDAGRVYASVTLADGKLYCVTRESGTFVLAASPNFEILAHNTLGDNSVFNASPAVSDGQLLLRSDRALYCIGQP
jgi:outer membrane protein assembly factor BamB